MPVTEKIRVLIVDDIAETRENIRRMLQFDSNIEVIGVAQTGREAISVAGKDKPDVIIMDINMPDMDGITATTEVKRGLPYVQVVILSVQSDPSYMRRAMLAGARDFLTKPPMIDELTDAVRRAGAMAAEEKKKIAPAVVPGQVDLRSQMTAQLAQHGKVIVVYSPKGGTGCTTVATNLAVALKTEESKVALIDGNIQFGDVMVFLNEKAKNSVLDLTARVDELDTDIVREVMLTHRGSGIDVLACAPRPEQADKVSAEQFGKLLTYLRGLYQYIIVDTTPYLTEPVQAALDTADSIILITNQDFPSIKSASQFLTLADVSGIGRDKLIFVMNRFDRRQSISPEKVGESLRQPIALSIPLEEKVVPLSVNRGTPFLCDNRTIPISKAILSLADLIKDQIQKAENPEPQPTAGRR